MKNADLDAFHTSTRLFLASAVCLMKWGEDLSNWFYQLPGL
jgi:hypothetical protein